jgi:cellobiose epimerase
LLLICCEIGTVRRWRPIALGVFTPAAPEKSACARVSRRRADLKVGPAAAGAIVSAVRTPPRAAAALLIGLLQAPTTTTAQAGGDDGARLRAALPVLRRNLEEAVVRFWYPRVVDRVHGGYRVAFDADGTPSPDGSKMIVTQARMLWLFARLARAGHRAPEMREAAAHGYRFLIDRMRDPQHGGYVWEVDETGTRVTDPAKVIYGQAFALYALSEYARLTNDATALAHATGLFELVDRHAHDASFGGYFEVFERDWSPPPASKASPIGGAPGAKLMNTHLHLLEAVAEYYRASTSPLARERLFELIAIEGSTVVRKDLVACTDEYRRDWTPVLEGSAARVSYGHDIENVWLLADAVETLGQSNALWLDLYRGLFDYSYRHGYDRQQGGFFYRGAFNAPADQREKIWWVQAEGLMSALTMYRLTRETTYARVFEETLRWVDEQQTDWQAGEWFAEVLPGGSTRGVKGDRWKEGYHNGRALVESIRIIESLTDDR